MRVADLIRMLEHWQAKHGPNAQIAVPRSSYQREVATKEGIVKPEFGEEEFIYSSNIATYLDSKGPEVDW